MMYLTSSVTDILQRRVESSSLPASLQGSLPACAQPCVSSLIQQSFLPSPCTVASNAECLCSNYSNTGYTLGEISLACLKSGCPNASTLQATSAYQICGQQSDPATPTHSVLTLLNSPSPSTSTSPSPSTTSITIGTISSASRPTVTTSATSFTTIVTAIPLNSFFPYPYPTNSTAPTTSTITPSQAVGISVGAIGGLLVILALLLCCCCIRRKRRRGEDKEKKKTERQHSYDFVDKAPPRSPFAPRHTLFEPVLLHPSERNTQLAGLGIQGHDHQHTQQTEPSKSSCDSDSEADSGSCRSIRSERTVSQLLPDKPPRSPHIVTQFAKRQPSVSSRHTRFEEDNTPKPQQTTFGSPTRPAPVQVNYHTHMHTRPQYAGHFTQSPKESQVPNLSIQIPSMRARGVRSPVAAGTTATNAQSTALASPTDSDNFPPSSPKYGQAVALPIQPLDARTSMPPNSAATYLPSYYTSNLSRTPVVTQFSPTENRKPEPVPKVPSRPVIRIARGSQASETSFESIDPDEVTPPEEVDHRLSPLQESSPISGIRYPKIPRSSNQSVPRSPPSFLAPKRLSPPRMSSLLAKRRGQEVPKQLERQLGVTTPYASSFTSTPSCSSSSSSSRPSTRRDPAVHTGSGPARNKGAQVYGSSGLSPNYSRQLSSQQRRAPAAMETPASPPWEPTLTPARRGNALLISVTPPGARLDASSARP